MKSPATGSTTTAAPTPIRTTPPWPASVRSNCSRPTAQPDRHNLASRSDDLGSNPQPKARGFRGCSIKVVLRAGEDAQTWLRGVIADSWHRSQDQGIPVERKG